MSHVKSGLQTCLCKILNLVWVVRFDTGNCSAIFISGHFNFMLQFQVSFLCIISFDVRPLQLQLKNLLAFPQQKKKQSHHFRWPLNNLFFWHHLLCHKIVNQTGVSQMYAWRRLFTSYMIQSTVKNNQMVGNIFSMK